MIEINAVIVGSLHTNCYIVRNPETGEGFLTDPGKEGDKILEEIARENVTIRGILITHSHFDHIGAAEELREKLSVPVISGAKEKTLLEDPKLNLSGVYTRHPLTVTPDRVYGDGEVFTVAGFRIRVLETPGHTGGGVCYYLQDEKVLLSGDTLFAGTYGMFIHPTGSHEEIIRSVERLVTELPEDTAVYPGHGPSTAIGIEKAGNPARAEYRALMEKDEQ